MESVAFFEKKLSLTPHDLNELKSTSLDDLLQKKAVDAMENKCSEQGFILPGSIRLLSRSMGYFESARFTGDTNYYVKLEGKVIYPVDGVQLVGSVMRKNKMGLYINYQDAIRIQIPRDLHLGNQEYDSVQVGDSVRVELKRSKFAIHDTYILASGLFLSRLSTDSVEHSTEESKQAEEESEAEAVAEVEAESEAEAESESESEAEES